jgi:hypothetical protein
LALSFSEFRKLFMRQVRILIQKRVRTMPNLALDGGKQFGLEHGILRGGFGEEREHRIADRSQLLALRYNAAQRLFNSDEL